MTLEENYTTTEERSDPTLPDALEPISPSAPLTVTEVGAHLRSPDLSLGIDKIQTLSHPVQILNLGYWDRTPTIVHGELSSRHYVAYVIGPDATTAKVVANDFGEYKPIECFIEANPSQNRSLQNVSDSLTYMEQIWDDVNGTLVVHGGSFLDARIIKLDVSTDVYPIADMKRIFTLLDHARPRPRWDRATHDSTGRGGGRTSQHTTVSAGEITVYDKSAEARLSTPTIRFEARIKKKARKRLNLQFVHQIDDAAIRLAFEYLAEPFIAALENDHGLNLVADGTYRSRLIQEAIGALVLEAGGFDKEFPTAPEKRRQHRKILKHLGIGDPSDILKIMGMSN